MTENLPAVPSPQAVAARNRSSPGRVTGRLKNALDRMVWHGDKRADAATAAGMTDHSLRVALKKPHVLAHLRAELASLREAERPRNVHRLTELRDQDENRNAAVKAVQTLEQLSTEFRGDAGAVQQRPGIVIVVTGVPAPAAPVTINSKPHEHIAADDAE